MEINDKLLEKLLQLSALQLNPQEREEMKGYLKETLSHFEKIKNIDTKNVQPLISPLNPPPRMRPDEPSDFPDKESLLEQAPQKQGALIKSPPAV